MPTPFFYRPPVASRLREFVVVCHQCQKPNPEFRLSMEGGHIFIRIHCAQCRAHEPIPAILIRSADFDG